MPALRTGTPACGPVSPTVGGRRMRRSTKMRPVPNTIAYTTMSAASDAATPGTPIGDALSDVRSRP